MASNNLDEKANFTRLSRLLVNKGTEALRITLDAIHLPANLRGVLNANRAFLSKFKPRIVNNAQWDLLFPPAGNPPDSKTFDVTLLSFLLRNICGFLPPATGWNKMPLDTDNSLQANITRIKQFYAHVVSTEVDKATFENLWQSISQALVDLKIPKQEIDHLRTDFLGPEEKSYLQIITEWVSKDEDCKNMLEDLKTDVKFIQEQQEDQQQSMQRLEQITAKNREGIQELCQSSLRESERQEILLQQLAKHNFSNKIKHMVEVFHPDTRDWLIKKVEDWFRDEDESRLLVITARPEFGKSIFAAKVCELFRDKGKLAACHFCEFNDSNLKDPKVILQSLASQMCENVPGFKEKLLDQLHRPHKVFGLKDAFRVYLQNPLDELELEPNLIVVDGLDESAVDDKRAMVNLIADYFPYLPKSLKILVTSRPELSLEKLSHFPMINIESNDTKNELDLLKYLKICLPSLAARDTENSSTPIRQHHSRILRMIVQRCEGSFLYAFHVQHDLCKRENLDTISAREILFSLPTGMGCVYNEYFQRLEMELEDILKKKPDLFKILELLVAANKALPLKFVTRALGLDLDCRETKRIINTVNEAVSCSLYVSNDEVTVFHKSVYDWLLTNGDDDHEYTVNISDGKRRLWLLCEQVFEEIKRKITAGHDLKLTNEVKHALEYGHMYLMACNMKTSFHWLVDMIIVHVLLTYYPKSTDYLHFLWGDVLRSDVAVDLQLRQRISWHLMEICSMDMELMKPSSSYLRIVLDYSPKGCFTDGERKIAEVILGKFFNVKRHSNGIKSLKLLLAKLFSCPITAIGVSSTKKLAAVALDSGTICVFCLPELVELFQCSTEYEHISCCIFSPEDSFVLYGKLGTALSIADKKVVSFFNEKVESFISCSFSPNGKRLATSNDSGTVKLWDVSTQRLVSVLCSRMPLNCCFFSKTGLFIIGYTKYAMEDSYCVWSAITFQRVDLRSVSGSKIKEKDGFQRSERCNRCFIQAHKEIIPWKELRNSTGIYNEVDCLFYLDEHYLYVVESIHLTTLAAWGLFLDSKRYLDCIDITAIEDDHWLYADNRKLLVFVLEPPKENRPCLSRQTQILWCSFSPDGTRIATCTSNRYINLWNVDTSQVYQRFRSNIGNSSTACWWSDKYLFVCHFNNEIPTLSLYPVDENLKITSAQMVPMPLIPVVKEFLPFSGILDFSEGYISFECGKKNPVKVIDVVKTCGFPKIVYLPGIRPMMSIAVSTGAAFVLGSGNENFLLWKRSEADPHVYIISAGFMNPTSSHLSRWCFSDDSKFAVSFLCAPQRFVFIDVDRRSCKDGVIDGRFIPSYHCVPAKLFCTSRVLVLVTSKLIEIFDLKSRKPLGLSLQRYFPANSVIHSKLSPKGTILAVPMPTGDVDFFQIGN